LREYVPAILDASSSQSAKADKDLEISKTVGMIAAFIRAFLDKREDVPCLHTVTFFYINNSNDKYKTILDSLR